MWEEGMGDGRAGGAKETRVPYAAQQTHVLGPTTDKAQLRLSRGSAGPVGLTRRWQLTFWEILLVPRECADPWWS